MISPRRICFLSCLLGSELRVADVVAVRVFLSCLLGSEHLIQHAFAGHDFLSCLLGSEQPTRSAALAARFSELPTRQ